MAKELNGQEVISEISTRLRARFNTTQFKEIYKDKPVQGMELPCIFIESVNTVFTPQLHRYSMWDYSIDIRCHPEKMRTNVETWARGLAVMIIETVSKLEISGQQVRATRFDWRVVDDVLHVYCNYSFRVIQTETPLPDMQTLLYGERIKK